MGSSRGDLVGNPGFLVESEANHCSSSLLHLPFSVSVRFQVICCFLIDFVMWAFCLRVCVDRRKVKGLRDRGIKAEEEDDKTFIVLHWLSC
ncbi:unnamed protein product [Microthlaspi erraticum]|uniref:Transmembrane protein n=1 Tax=Microthlaspi erraticum TaxID=1685480 RepID=A0A6D2JKH1_9BRAS|nr:unnamed protein product [Microthlaspi erraticum]